MNDLVHPREKLYLGICVVLSALIYIALLVSVIGILYIVLFALLAITLQGFFVGNLRGNGIRVTEAQFPEVAAIAKRLSEQMELKQTPAVYILQAGGLLNAFATRFLGRNFVVIYSDVLELAYEQGEDALTFVLAHELAHIKRNHLMIRPFIAPALAVPYLGSAYLRCCEYTCDAMGASFEPRGAVPGLLVLGAGKRLYRRVNAVSVAAQPETERGFFVWYSELFSSHPYLPKRLAAVMQQQQQTPAATSFAASNNT